jgi:hypothetical protein
MKGSRNADDSCPQNDYIFLSHDRIYLSLLQRFCQTLIQVMHSAYRNQSLNYGENGNSSRRTP